MKALAYFADEAARSIWRRRGASLLALLTCAVSLFVLGSLLLAGTIAGNVLQRWSAAAEFSIYLADDATADARAALERRLAASGLVAGVTFVSADDALRRFRTQFPDLAAAAASLPANPLPASYEVRVRPELAHEPAVDRLAASLREVSGVSDVRYDRRWIERLLGLVGGMRRAGVAIALVLVLAACLTIMSVVRLALHARRQEIEIMQLVGAPLAYIRGPFVLEGTLLGLSGAVLATAALWVLYLSGRGRVVGWASGLMDIGDLRFLPLSTMAAVVIGGALIGCVGGLFAARAAR
jgi:cell division transport system permease protein